MIVLRTTHEAVKARLAGVEAANRLLIAERDWHSNAAKGWRRDLEVAEAETAHLRAQLANAYIRDAKGRIARYTGEEA